MQPRLSQWPYLAPVIITNSFLASAVFGVGAAGASVTFGGIEQALRGNQAIDVSTRQPAQPRQVIYGVSRVAGAIVGWWTTGNHKDYLNTAVVWAGHSCRAIAELYADSKLVRFADHGGAWGDASSDTFHMTRATSIHSADSTWSHVSARSMPIWRASERTFRSGLRTNSSDGVESRHIEVDVSQKDISVYEWSLFEEMTPSGSVSPQRNDPGLLAFRANWADFANFSAEMTVRSGSERCDFIQQNIGVQNGVCGHVWHANRLGSICMAAWGARRSNRRWRYW